MALYLSHGPVVTLTFEFLAKVGNRGTQDVTTRNEYSVRNGVCSSARRNERHAFMLLSGIHRLPPYDLCISAGGKGKGGKFDAPGAFHVDDLLQSAAATWRSLQYVHWLQEQDV